MTVPTSRPTVAGSAFAHAASALLEATGLTRQVRIQVRKHGTAARAVGHHKLVVSQAITTESAAFQSWTAAHEIAHIALGHRPAVLPVGLLGVGAGCWIAGIAAKLAGIGLWTAVLPGLGMAATIAALIVNQRPTLTHEREADHMAASCGLPGHP